MKEAVERVIEALHDNLSERITIDDMARIAMFSKFHFTRIFRDATGVSPGRFLSAIRLQEAKRLLLSTSLSVTEISTQVGYTSVGTFSSRFKSSVGLPPSAYRQFGGFTPRITMDHRRRAITTSSITLRGRVRPPLGAAHGPIFLGLFPDCILQGSPIRCTMLDLPGRFSFEGVPQGTWYLLSQSVAAGTEESAGCQSPFVAAKGPIVVRQGTAIKPVELQLRPMETLDPPVLLALLGARRVALSA